MNLNIVVEKEVALEYWVVIAELNHQVAELSVGEAGLAKQPSWRNWYRAVSVQLFQIMLDVANEIGHFYRHAATQ